MTTPVPAPAPTAVPIAAPLPPPAIAPMIAPAPAPMPTFFASSFFVDAASREMRAVRMLCDSLRTVIFSNRNATEARPFTLPDGAAASTLPDTSDPEGATVAPSITIGFASLPRTRSSTLLVSDATAVSSVTAIDVPDGIVTSLNDGFGGGGGVPMAEAAGAAPLAGRPAWA